MNVDYNKQFDISPTASRKYGYAWEGGEVFSTCVELKKNGKGGICRTGNPLHPLWRILGLTISDLLSQIAVNHVIRPDAAAHLQCHLLLPGRRF